MYWMLLQGNTQSISVDVTLTFCLERRDSASDEPSCVRLARPYASFLDPISKGNAALKCHIPKICSYQNETLHICHLFVQNTRACSTIFYCCNFLFAAKFDSISSLRSLNLRLDLHFPLVELKSNWWPKKRRCSCLEMAADRGHWTIQLHDEKAAGERAKNKDPSNLIW